LHFIYVQEKIWTKLVRLNKKLEEVGLANVLVHFQREMELAKPLLVFEKVEEDSNNTNNDLESSLD